MTIADVLKARLTGFAGLSALVSTRVHPEEAPQNSKRPYVTYRVISEFREYGFGGGIGIVQARYQFDVFVDGDVSGYAAGRAVIEQLRQALDFWSSPSSSPEVIGVTVENVVDGYEPDTGYFHPIIDFQVIYRE